MNPLNEKKGIFFLVLACLGQVFLVLSCTLWRGIILPPVPWKCPPSGAGLLVLAAGRICPSGTL